MVRAKNGTRMSHISVMNKEVDSTWITNHYDGLLETVHEPNTNILTENSLDIETEALITLETNVVKLDKELLTVSFVGDSRPTPNATSGEFKAS